VNCDITHYLHDSYQPPSLVGGFKHFLFSIIYGMSSFPLTNSIIFQDGYGTTNQKIFQHIHFDPTAQNGGLRRQNFRRFPADSAGPVPYLVRGAGGKKGMRMGICYWLVDDFS
jgi:hypothetical protein